MTESVIPAPISVPAAPTTRSGIATLDPLSFRWAAGTGIVRVYDVAWGSREFYAGDDRHPARFSPITPDGHSNPVPVLYGADDDAGTLSETIFHDVPVTGPNKRVPYPKLVHQQLITLEASRPLTLIDLTSAGLSRLGLTRPQLIDSDPRSYPGTRAWSRALHDHPLAPDGLYWVSRQHDRSVCLVLFGDRVAQADLIVAADPPRPLAVGAGLDAACAVADRAGITITGLPST